MEEKNKNKERKSPTQPQLFESNSDRVIKMREEHRVVYDKIVKSVTFNIDNPKVKA